MLSCARSYAVLLRIDHGISEVQFLAGYPQRFEHFAARFQAALLDAPLFQVLVHADSQGQRSGDAGAQPPSERSPGQRQPPHLGRRALAARDLRKQFRRELLAFAERKGAQAERLYQINLGFFPIDKQTSNKE